MILFCFFSLLVLDPWLPYYSHRREALQYQNENNILLLNYEEMIENLAETIDKVSVFLLNRKANQNDMKALLEHLHFDNFRLNASVNGTEMSKVGVLNAHFEQTGRGFIRRGQSGAKHEEFERVRGLLQEANEWIEQNERQLAP